MLPKQYEWLLKEGSPKMLVEALKLYGTIETPGNKNNPIIMAWAKEVGLEKIYSGDDVPWCGLFMAVVAKRAGKQIVNNPLWAVNWGRFGNKVDKAMLGDVLVFSRNGGGHVALYIGEDSTAYHVLGGNQSDAVTIARIAKARCTSIRRATFSIAQPVNIRSITLASTGKLSTNEA